MAPSSPIPELVSLICYWASERGERLTAVRLVKFLYLADLYNARVASGQTITSWTWRFVHFGPYCRESLSAVDEAVAAGLVLASPYTSRHDDSERFLYSSGSREEPAVANELPQYVLSKLKAAVKRWADDTPGLLDHVYFETKPMADVRPGDQLDFSGTHPETKTKTAVPLKLSKAQAERGRVILASLRERTRRRETALDSGPHDPAFIQLEADDDMPDLGEGFRVVAELNLDDNSLS